MQLFWILTHLDIQQQHPGQGNAEAVFWQTHQAFLDAGAPAEYDMILWAGEYQNYQLAHPDQQLPPVVVQLSSQIMEWAQHGPPGHHQENVEQPGQPFNLPFAVEDAAAAAANYNGSADNTVEDAAYDSAEFPTERTLSFDFMNHSQVGQDVSHTTSPDGIAVPLNADEVGWLTHLAPINDPAGNQDYPLDALPQSHGQNTSAVQHGEPHVFEFLHTVVQEDTEDEAVALDVQASSQLLDITAGMQASTSSQYGLLVPTPQATVTGDIGSTLESHVSPSTQESVHNMPLPEEQVLGQDSLLDGNLDMDTWGIPDDVQPASMPEVTGAHLRLALAAVRARVDAETPLSRAQAGRLAEVTHLYGCEA